MAHTSPMKSSVYNTPMTYNTTKTPNSPSTVAMLSQLSQLEAETRNSLLELENSVKNRIYSR